MELFFKWPCFLGSHGWISHYFDSIDLCQCKPCNIWYRPKANGYIHASFRLLHSAFPQVPANCSVKAAKLSGLSDFSCKMSYHLFYKYDLVLQTNGTQDNGMTKIYQQGKKMNVKSLRAEVILTTSEVPAWIKWAMVKWVSCRQPKITII